MRTRAHARTFTSTTLASLFAFHHVTAFVPPTLGTATTAAGIPSHVRSCLRRNGNPSVWNAIGSNNAAARSNRTIVAARSNRKDAPPTGGDASSDDALPSVHVATIGAPGIAGHSSRHPNRLAGPAIVRSTG